MGSLGKLRLTRMDFAKALFESWPLSPIANCLTRRVGSIWNFDSSAIERIKRTVVEAFSYNRDNETLDVNSGDYPQVILKNDPLLTPRVVSCSELVLLTTFSQKVYIHLVLKCRQVLFLSQTCLPVSSVARSSENHDT